MLITITPSKAVIATDLNSSIAILQTLHDDQGKFCALVWVVSNSYFFKCCFSLVEGLGCL